MAAHRGQALAMLASLGLAIAACSNPADSAAVDAADDRAHRAGVVMSREDDALDMVRRVVGGDPEQGTAIEALVAEGDRFNGRIVLRITEHDADPDFGTDEVSTVRCYEYRLDNSIDDLEGDHIACPDLPAMTIPEAAPPPTVPEGIDDALLAALQRLAASGADVAAVEADLAPLANGAARFEVVEVPGEGIGVVFGNGDGECVSGRITTEGTVEVWRVPRVVAQPGELGCDAGAAARGNGKESPH